MRIRRKTKTISIWLSGERDSDGRMKSMRKAYLGVLAGFNAQKSLIKMDDERWRL